MDCIKGKYTKDISLTYVNNKRFVYFRKGIFLSNNFQVWEKGLWVNLFFKTTLGKLKMSKELKGFTKKIPKVWRVFTIYVYQISDLNIFEEFKFSHMEKGNYNWVL